MMSHSRSYRDINSKEDSAVGYHDMNLRSSIDDRLFHLRLVHLRLVQRGIVLFISSSIIATG